MNGVVLVQALVTGLVPVRVRAAEANHRDAEAITVAILDPGRVEPSTRDDPSAQDPSAESPSGSMARFVRALVSYHQARPVSGFWGSGADPVARAEATGTMRF